MLASKIWRRLSASKHSSNETGETQPPDRERQSPGEHEQGRDQDAAVVEKAQPTRSLSQRFPMARRKTELGDGVIADRGYSHKWIIRKPRALQFEYNGHLIKLPSHTEVLEPAHSEGVKDATIRTTDNAALQRSRLDLFVDLIWVAIIGNIADSFGELAFAGSSLSFSNAILAFIVLFVPVWRLWNTLRDFLNHFYLDDMIQRYFVVWILMLMFVYGNSAPFLLTVHEDGTVESTGARTLVIVYLIAKGSFLVIETLYSFAIPWLRKITFVGWLLAIPATGLWVGGLYTSWPNQAGCFITAAFLEYAAGSYLTSPRSDVLLGKGFRKAHDTEHLVERVSSFFIIFLGAGVFLLISGSPCGAGITSKTGTGVQALFIFYSLNWLYFNGAQDLKYVHALNRSWWRRQMWLFLHMPILGPLLIFGAAIKYLVVHADFQPNKESQDPTPGGSPARLLFRREEVTNETTENLLHTARWCATIAISISLAAMTVIAVLNRPLDRPGTMRLNNRYARLALRPVVIVVMLCITIYKSWSTPAFVGVVAGVIWVLLIWEWSMGRVHGGGFFEPWNTKGEFY